MSGPHFSGTVATSNARRVLHYGVRRGLPNDVNAEPPVNTTAARRIPSRRMFDIWATLARHLGTADLPIAIAREVKLEDLELLGFAILTAPTMREGLETFVTYDALLNDGRRWEIVKDTKQITLTLVESSPRVLGVRLSHETTLAQVVVALRQLAGRERVDPLSVEFAHRAPFDSRAHHALFRCELRFDASIDRIVFPREPFDSVPATGNRALWRYLCVQADEAIAQLAPRPLADRVRDEVRRAVMSGLVPEMTAIAATLGTTERTLRRSLVTTSKISFRQLVDQTRREHALTLLSSSDAPQSLTRVAFDAGFSDTSAFTHACRRWFGRAPSEVVRAARDPNLP